MADNIPPPPPGFSPVQSAPPPPPGFSPVQQADPWRDSGYGFKIKDVVAPLDGKQIPTVQRDDGQVYLNGGWKALDPKTGVYVPGTDRPMANKSFLDQKLGPDAWKSLGRNLQQGWNSAVEGTVGLGHDIAHAAGIESDPAYIQHINEMEAQQRTAQAFRNQGGSGASFAQGMGQAAPIIAGATMAPGAIPALASTEGLPYTAQLASQALPLAASTYVMTPGTPNQRALAGTEAGAGAAIGQFGAQKILAPLASATGEAIGNAFPKVGAVARTVAEKLGLPTTTPNESMAPQVVLQRFLDKIKGKPSDVVQEDLATQYAAARAKYGAPFNELRANGGTVDMQPYTDSIDTAIQQVGDSGFRPSVKDSTIKQLEDLKSAATEGPVTWGKALDMGTDINDAISEAMHGANPNRNLARILEGPKAAHMASMDQSGAAEGDLYRQAKQGWIDNVVPWDDPKEGGKLIKSFIDSPTPDKAMDALMRAKSEDQVGLLVNKLSQNKGIPAFQAGLVRSVYDQSLDDSGRVIPSKFIGALKSRSDAYNLAFKGDDKWAMDGLNTLLKDSRFIAQALTGEWLRSVPGGRALPGSAFPTPDAGSILQKIFTTPLGRKMLVDASSFKPGSPMLGKIIDTQLPKVIGVTAGRIGSPTQENPDVKRPAP